MSNVIDPRAQFRSLVNSISLVLALTLAYYTHIPAALAAGIVSLVAIALGLGESIYDNRHKTPAAP